MGSTPKRAGPIAAVAAMKRSRSPVGMVPDGAASVVADVPVVVAATCVDTAAEFWGRFFRRHSLPSTVGVPGSLL